MQQGRAWARLGDARQTRATLSRVEVLVSPLSVPDRPEHHYRYDPPKAQFYVATTLSWLGDTAAEGITRQVLAAIQAPGLLPRSRRAALARLDLALRRARRAGVFRETDSLAGLERHDHPGGAGQLPGSEVEGELVLGEPAAGVAHPPGLAVDHQVRAAVADQGRGQVGPVDVQLGQVPPGRL